MRFTKLRLNGFKSFVDPTDLVIHEGLTGIVGPNGCGKSNLLEALRWVMGENRASAMRGSGMEDVIFNGAATRPARHFAEVALIIDNGERLAPTGFNDADQIEIVRRITRDAGSAYRANTRDVRARDVQMLFADASTGAHSPALVRQGQITELINAKPKARRMILEEAAGISGLYQRRHEAELRLSAAEQNLTRVDDVIEALAQQLSALNRQAKQAARYREIGEELRRAEAMALYRRWREAEAQRAEAEAQLRQRLALTAQAEAAVRAAGQARQAAEDALPPLREEEAIAGAILQRLILQRDALGEEESRARDTIEALAARITQLGRDLDREAGLNSDAGESITRLDWEIDQLTRAAEGQDDRLAAAAEAARAAASDLASHEERLSEATEDAARLAARHQSAQRLLADTQTGVARAEGELSRARSAVTAAQSTLAATEAALSQAEAGRIQAAADAEATETRLTTAEATRAALQDRESEARAQRSAVEGEAAAVRAEVAALQRLVAQEAQAGQQMIDRLSVVPGYEAALGAALSDDLRAPELNAQRRSGWANLPPYGTDYPLPTDVRPLAAHVTAPAALARRLHQIGLVDAARGDALQPALRPGQRLVSLEGDLWRWDGYKVDREDAPSATALRLKQLNRLAQLKRDLEELTNRAAGASQAHDRLRADLTAATQSETAARDARRQADQRLAEGSRAASRAEADLSMAQGRLETSTLAVTRHSEDQTEAAARLGEAQAAMADLGDLATARAALDAARAAVDVARTSMLARRSAHDEVRREGEARIRRRQEAQKELSGWKHRRETAETRATELTQRRAETEAELAAASAAPGEIATRRAALADALDAAETRRRKAADSLALAETALRSAQAGEREAEHLASDAREERARSEARLEAARETVLSALNRMEEESGASPEVLLATLKLDPDKMPDLAALETDIARLKRQREALGSVNLRAEEDAKAVESEYDTLVAEKVDLEEAIKKLRAGIAGLNREGRERLLTAFEQVNATFGQLFTHLFGGGEARLVLVESDDPLEAGLEIMCQPPGKRLSTLSLLSGGEQTLTAMALIFGVFLTNPAPICVLDEVDAPLDDANVTRFCDLMDEMTRRTETRFLVITHHAVTMSRMDRLFGVTMAEQGVSQLVSVDLTRAAAMVA